MGKSVKNILTIVITAVIPSDLSSPRSYHSMSIGMTVRKVSISLPQDVYQAVLDSHPDLPLSQVITDLLKNALGITGQEMFGMTDGKTTISPELVDIIRAVVRQEIMVWQQEQTPEDKQPPSPVEKMKEERHVTEDTETYGLSPEKWYTQAEVRERLPASINPNTKKSKISKAVASGRLVSNGEKGLESRIHGQSAIEWLKTIIHDHPPDQQQE